MSRLELIKLCLLHINHSYHEIKLLKSTITEEQLFTIITNLIVDLKDDQKKISIVIDSKE